jgi:hypothetical protein
MLFAGYFLRRSLTASRRALLDKVKKKQGIATLLKARNVRKAIKPEQEKL